MNVLRTLALFALYGLSMAARAQTVYVADHLELGLHESPQITSPILQLLPTGSALEVLEREGNMTRVRTGDGVSGWTDERFLAATQPARARVQALETELAGAQAALADAQAKLVAAEAAAGDNESSASETTPSDALREMQRLAQENQRMKQQVAELEAMQRMALEQAAAAPATPTQTRSTPSPGSPPWLSWQYWKSWKLLLAASVLLLAFSAGGWLVDWDVRRRHGGYRI